MPTINIPDKIRTKICKTCKEEREILLFEIKSRNKRRSVCRFCKSAVPYSFYNYQTKEHQELARKNNKIINKHLKRIKLNRHVCSCGSIRELGKSLCNTCRLNSIKKNNCRKRKPRTIEQEKIKNNKNVEKLSLKYVRSIIKKSIKNTNDLIIKSEDISDDLLQNKRNQLLLKRKIKNNDNKEEQHSN